MGFSYEVTTKPPFCGEAWSLQRERLDWWLKASHTNRKCLAATLLVSDSCDVTSLFGRDILRVADLSLTGATANKQQTFDQHVKKRHS